MSKTRVLLVDDEASIRSFVGAGLMAEGFKVAKAEDGDVACRVSA